MTANFPSAIPPAFGGRNVLIPTTSGAYSYLYQRKFLLVNGTHTTLAFMTLRQFCQDPADAPGKSHILFLTALQFLGVRLLSAMNTSSVQCEVKTRLCSAAFRNII